MIVLPSLPSGALKKEEVSKVKWLYGYWVQSELESIYQSSSTYVEEHKIGIGQPLWDNDGVVM